MHYYHYQMRSLNYLDSKIVVHGAPRSFSSALLDVRATC